MEEDYLIRRRHNGETGVYPLRKNCRKGLVEV